MLVYLMLQIFKLSIFYSVSTHAHLYLVSSLYFFPKAVFFELFFYFMKTASKI